MKENVDLTINRDFRYKANHSTGISLHTPHIPQTGRSRFNLIDEDYYLSRDTGCVVQGNGETRKVKKLCDEFGQCNFCDCCGCELKPYYQDTLCERCNQPFEDNVKRELF